MNNDVRPGHDRAGSGDNRFAFGNDRRRLFDNHLRGGDKYLRTGDDRRRSADNRLRDEDECLRSGNDYWPLTNNDFLDGDNRIVDGLNRCATAMTVSESSMGVDEREIIVNETGLIAFVGKTRAARRRIPMTPRVTAITNSRIASSADSWIFSAPTRSGHMEGSSVRKQQTRVFSVTDIKPFELYCLRHTCLTRWSPKMDPFTLAYLAGHSDISITKSYVHPEDETIKAAMERAASEQLSAPSTPPVFLKAR